MSKNSILMGALVPLIAATLVAQDVSPAKLDEAAQKALIANERALLTAVAKNDKAAFQSLVEPDGVWATVTGFVPMGPLANGLTEFEMPNWTIENPRVVWTDGNAALLLYIRTGGGSFGGRTLPPMMLASTLWTKRAGKWLAVNHQESELRQ